MLQIEEIMLAIMVITDKLISDHKLRQRKDQQRLTSAEWSAFLGAFRAVSALDAPSPNLQDFVTLYERAAEPIDVQARKWRVFSSERPGYPGINCLAWHREYLAKFEMRLMCVDPSVRIPYWNWTEHPTFPPALGGLEKLGFWNVLQEAIYLESLPSIRQIRAALAEKTFTGFQTTLEQPWGPSRHNPGGDLSMMNSPNDPIFFLNHAYMDKLWADWSKLHPGEYPPNLHDQLNPPPIITGRVLETINVRELGYVYV